jgi:hypothetical protein
MAVCFIGNTNAVSETNRVGEVVARSPRLGHRRYNSYGRLSLATPLNGKPDLLGPGLNAQS